ncbi:MAG: DUF3800 domain-containing protein [Chloroflexi bacterium]|nr:DUF3800 domain-containing protein [Chloroflexota bacterium]
MSMLFAGDESGNLSFAFSQGGTPYFVLALVGFEDPNQVYARVEQFRRARGLVRREFSFHEIKSQRLKERLLQFLATLPLTAWVLVVKKADLAEPYRLMPNKTLYAFFLSEAIAQIPPLYRKKRNLILDEYDSSGELFLELGRLFKTRGIERGFKKIVAKRSSSETLIQIADLIAGATFRKFTKGNDRYFDLIRDQVIVAEFPKTQKPPS